jgi:hypothetical protein
LLAVALTAAAVVAARERTLSVSPPAHLVASLPPHHDPHTHLSSTAGAGQCSTADFIQHAGKKLSDALIEA